MTQIMATHWMDRDGNIIKITDMASSHLLAAIHMIERNRFTNAIEAAQKEAKSPDLNYSNPTIQYYLQWPIQYGYMIAEAQRRGLIHRTPSKSIVKEIQTLLERNK